MTARTVAPRGWMLLLGMLMLLPASVAQGGCTPCECGVAYCEDGRTYWPAIDVESAGEIAVVRLQLLDAEGRAPMGEWLVGHEIIVAWQPQNGTDMEQPRRTDFQAQEVIAPRATFPSQIEIETPSAPWMVFVAHTHSDLQPSAPSHDAVAPWWLAGAAILLAARQRSSR